jgi:dihydrofolate reductase
LLGRRTYERFASYWPLQKDNPYTEMLNQQQKYVVSTTEQAPLPWVNSTVVNDDPAKAVEALKRRQDLVILGSGELIQSLLGRRPHRVHLADPPAGAGIRPPSPTTARSPSSS